MNKRVPAIIVVCITAAALGIGGIGCGSANEATTTTAPPAASTTSLTPVTSSTAAAVPTPTTTGATPTTAAAAAGEETPATQTLVTQAPADNAWATIITLRSTDSLWQGLENVRVSKPFTLTGEARLVLDMPDAGEFDGVIIMIIPAVKATDLTALVDALPNGVAVVLVKNAPVKAVSGLTGTFVLVNSVPGAKAWSVDLQAQR